MCGITGFFGSKAVATAVERLRLLEYRGYDSAGVAYLKDGTLRLKKAVGRIANLEQKLDEESSVAIAHTRWATHGRVNETNAHPHTYGEANWAVVHNGIIENYKEIGRGEEFASETDTERIAYLLEKNGEGLSSVLSTAKALQGSFAFLALSKEGRLFAFKRKSPLCLACSDSGVMVASDPACFCCFSSTYFDFADFECAEITSAGVKFYDFDGNVIVKTGKKLEIQSVKSGKGEFEHFMLKEIYDTPTAISAIEKTYTEQYLQSCAKMLEPFEKIYFIGCGTAYHASLYGANIFNACTDKDCRAYNAGEFVYGHDKVDEKTVCVFVSQSGETADTLSAEEKARGAGAYTVALTNVGYSSLAMRCDRVLPVLAGPERAVASTKAYTAQINILARIARFMEGLKTRAINWLSREEIDCLSVEARALALRLAKKDLFLIGRKNDYVTALESALKIKEVGYVNANAYASSELKHGFIALIEEGTPVITFVTDDSIAVKTVSGALEAKARGAYSVLLTTLALAEESEFDEVVRLKNENSVVVFAQLLAYHIALLKGNDPDMPRNLAKAVTVE